MLAEDYYYEINYVVNEIIYNIHYTLSKVLTQYQL